MENKLISMVDFVLATQYSQLAEFKMWSDTQKFKSVLDYANFLNTPLNLGMFVPAIEVNGKWEVLEEPESDSHDFYGQPIYDNYVDCIEYQQAKDKVIFEGFEVYKYNSILTAVINRDLDCQVFGKFKSEDLFLQCMGLKTIQDLIKYTPTLTEYGKQISGLNK